jgi:phosphotransferase system HPr-like phosphotransfer protein
MKVVLKDMKTILEFVHLAEQFQEDIDVTDGHYIVSGKSILGLCALASAEVLTATIMKDDKTEFNAVMARFSAAD